MTISPPSMVQIVMTSTVAPRIMAPPPYTLARPADIFGLVGPTATTNLRAALRWRHLTCRARVRLVWAKYSNPPESYQQIIQRVLSAVDPLTSLAGKCKTGGRLNLVRALVSNGDGNWHPTSTLNTAYDSHTATLLPGGQVLVAGGYGTGGALASSKLYAHDPNNGTGTWTATF